MKGHDAPHAGEILGHDGPIPGEREPDTLTHAEPGALGAGVAGERIPRQGQALPIDEARRHEIEKEAGGG